MGAAPVGGWGGGKPLILPGANGPATRPVYRGQIIFFCRLRQPPARCKPLCWLVASHPEPLVSPSPSAIPSGFLPLPSGSGFIEVNGPLYLRQQGDQVRLGLRVEPRHVNPMGNLHGGMMASFCDMLIPLTVHRTSEHPGQRFLPTISLQIDYLAPAPLGCWIEGRAELLRATRTLVFAQGLVTADGVPCARASGVFKIGPELPAGFRA